MREESGRAMKKIMLELPVWDTERERTYLLTVDVSSIELFYQSARTKDDQCLLRVKSGVSYNLAIGYAELKCRIREVCE